MRALIQKRQREFTSVNTCAAYLGLQERGYEIDFFEVEELADINLSDLPLVVAGVPVIQKVFKRWQIDLPELESIPSCLSAYAGRKVWSETLGQVRQRIDLGEAVFIKPVASQLKSFTGHVIHNYRDLAITAGLPATQVVVCSSPVEMLAEYRVYVVHGQIIGCKHYYGDYRKTPDFSQIDQAIKAYNSAPHAYAIDFAVTAANQTILIEVNDAYALGSYGLHPMLYAGLLETRWLQLTASLR